MSHTVHCSVFIVISEPNHVFRFRNAFGATAPPFIDYLKDILRRYPDGGQILKVGLVHILLQAYYYSDI